MGIAGILNIVCSIALTSCRWGISYSSSASPLVSIKHLQHYSPHHTFDPLQMNILALDMPVLYWICIWCTALWMLYIGGLPTISNANIGPQTYPQASPIMESKSLWNTSEWRWISLEHKFNEWTNMNTEDIHKKRIEGKIGRYDWEGNGLAALKSLKLESLAQFFRKHIGNP